MAAQTTAAESLPAWKTSLIDLALRSQILTFGTFTLKSHRISPYFVNCGLFCTGELIEAISSAYARTLLEYSASNPAFQFDVLFGPAYKGIPLAATTALQLAALEKQQTSISTGGASASSSGKFAQIGYSFNRKEVKDHGEGGLMVGRSLAGQRVVIIDDVITAGTAIREAIEMIRAQGGTLVGVIVAIDRQEKMPSQAEKEGKGDDGTPRGSAIGEVVRETGVPVLAVLTLGNIVEGLKNLGRHEEVGRMEEYRRQYGATDA
jgi:orotate phosphoribosyltransferase